MSQPDQEAEQSAIGKLFSQENLEQLQQSRIHLSELSDDEISYQVLMHELIIEKHRSEKSQLLAELRKRNKLEKKPRGRPSNKSGWEEMIPEFLLKFEQSPELSEAKVINQLLLQKYPYLEELEAWEKTIKNRISDYRKKQK